VRAFSNKANQSDGFSVPFFVVKCDATTKQSTTVCGVTTLRVSFDIAIKILIGAKSH
jgi:hypothetical protein